MLAHLYYIKIDMSSFFNKKTQSTTRKLSSVGPTQCHTSCTFFVYMIEAVEELKQNGKRETPTAELKWEWDNAEGRKTHGGEQAAQKLKRSM